MCRAEYLGLDDQGHRHWKRYCGKCGKAFVSRATNAFYCRECQRERLKLRKREFYRILRNTKGLYLGVIEGRRTWKRECRKCGKTFKTTGSHKFYCDECQNCRYNLQADKKIMGTFGLKYLELYGGRIRGAVMLEKGMAINSRRYYRIAGLWEASKGFDCEVNDLITICKENCSECGAEMTIARENGYYTIPAELCCTSCGLVCEIDDLV